MTEDIILKWNIHCKPEPIYHTTWDIDNRCVLKVYHDLATLKRNCVMMKTLYEEGIPVPKVIELPSGADYYEKDGNYYILTTKLFGSKIVDLNNCKEERFYRFGEILAQLHLAFRKCEAKINCWNNSMLEEMKGWVSSTINKFNPKWLNVEEAKNSITELGALHDDLPKQLIHRDVHLGNFLFNEERFTGYIDFDLSQRNIRTFDLCYFLLNIFIELKNTHEDEVKWLRIISQVIHGYDSKISLLSIERKAIPCIMKNIELLFVAYFLGEGNEKLARDASYLFDFVNNSEIKIQEAVNL